MNTNKLLLSIAISLAVSLPIYAQGPKAGSGAGGGQGSGQDSAQDSSQDQQVVTQDQAHGPDSHTQEVNNCLLEPDEGDHDEMNEDIAEQLQFMGEEEKLARDVYVYLDALWDTNVFINISKAEQMHIDSVNTFLEAYNIPNLASDEYGVFTNPDLQELYDSLIAKGRLSPTDAFMVGALVEEVDIKDLLDILAEINDPAMIQMYTGLLEGSYNHLRAFVKQLDSLGVSYRSQGVLTQAQVDTILAGENLQVTLNSAETVDAEGISTPSESCFISEMSANSHVVRNGIRFNPTDHINLSSSVRANIDDQGKNAQLVAVANYTPESGNSSFFMRDQESWVAWDGRMTSLSYAEQVNLEDEQRLEIFSGNLGTNKGQYVIYSGYVLDDGSVTYTTDPMRFNVQD